MFRFFGLVRKVLKLKFPFFLKISSAVQRKSASISAHLPGVNSEMKRQRTIANYKRFAGNTIQKSRLTEILNVKATWLVVFCPWLRK